MNINATRYVDFLWNYTYYPNSIGFRIVSSTALEKWKNVQAFQLNQISNGKFSFCRHEKEILLLQYDLWSRWLQEVENLFIEICNERSHRLCEITVPGDCDDSEVCIVDLSCTYDSNHAEIVVTNDDVNAILNLAAKVVDTFNDITQEKYSGRFPRDYMDTRSETHEHVYDLFKYQIRGIVGHNFEAAFIAITDITIKAMQFCLLEMHELNTLFQYVEQGHPVDRRGSLPFVTFTEMDVLSLKLKGQCLTSQRFENYRRRYGISKIYVKNYASTRVPVEVFRKLEDSSAEIEYKMNY